MGKRGMMNDERLDEIRDRWVISHTNAEATRDMWDSMAPSFGRHPVPSFGQDPLLDLLGEQEMVGPNKSVLDIGCGTGTYALALANEVRMVVATDFSQEMLQIAEERRAELGIENVEFVEADWHTLNVGDYGWEKSFDLALANMSPAVQSAQTLDKMNQTSRGWCVLTRAVRRTDPVSDQIKKMLNIRGGVENGDDDFLYAFEMLCRQGYEPQVDYRSDVWRIRKTLEEASLLYLNRMRSYRTLTEDEENVVLQFLKSQMEYGLVYESVTSTIVTLYWRVDDK